MCKNGGHQIYRHSEAEQLFKERYMTNNIRTSTPWMYKEGERELWTPAEGCGAQPDPPKNECQNELYLKLLINNN